jgi:YegS/Rv2252/BmrU family lipid kinase
VERDLEDDGHPRVLAILNPWARHGLAARLEPPLRDVATERPGWSLAVTTCPAEAEKIAAETPDVDVVLAAGGDGTVHEVVNGLMARPADDRPSLAVLPAGSGDDYAHMLGIKGALPDCLRMIDAGRTRRLDVGRCNGVYFMNSLSLGLDARVTARVTELKKTTSQTGLPLYFRGLLHILFRDYRSHDLTLTLDDGEPSRVAIMLAAAGIGPTYGGGFKIVPLAQPDDGLLDFLYVDALPLAGALWRLPFVVTGHHLGMKPVHLARVRRALVVSEEPLLGQVDGECLEARRYDITIEAAALEVLVP